MKFLIDMPLSPKTAEYLKSLGHDAVHLFSLGKERATDYEIIQLAKKERRIILTCDLDFGVILAHSKSVIPGVIIFRIEYATPEKINRYLKSLLDTISVQQLENSIISVDNTKARIRKLPL